MGLFGRCFATLSAVKERPGGQADGTDWYGCHWRVDKATFGYVQDPDCSVLVGDITKWSGMAVIITSKGCERIAERRHCYVQPEQPCELEENRATE